MPDRLAQTSVPVHELIARRWSPRAFDPEAVLEPAALAAVLEAARWASSWGGSQPARFVVGRRGDATFEGLVETLSRGNRGWAPRASALILGVAQVNDGEKALTHSAFDLGQAMAQLALQAVAQGLVTHPMAGFDAAAARARFTIPDDHEPLVLLALGALADPSTLDDGLRAKEERPRRRRALDEIAYAGTWGSPAL